MSRPDRAENGNHRSGGDLTAAEAILRSMRRHGVEYAFCNFGTDHPALLEAVATVREAGEADSLPTFVTCPHETVALAAAHGYAQATGQAQAVIAHVDVGTQNLGAMVHNAHRGNAPVLIFAGLAPVSHDGDPGSRRGAVHYFQDVYDQPGIVRQYCKWTREFRPPGDPAELVARGLKLANTPRRGPTYLTATAEALETRVDAGPRTRSIDPVGPTPADQETVTELAELVGAAEAPLVVTSKLGLYDPVESVDALVSFAEAAGAGVVEVRPAALCFPRHHDLHMGFDAGPAVERADLVVLADVDVPWVPGPNESPSPDVDVVQVDVDPSKPTYPQWDLRVDRAVHAAPAPTLAAVADRLDPADGSAGRSIWRAASESHQQGLAETLDDHREAGRLTPEVLSAAIGGLVDDSTIVVSEATTNSTNVLEYVPLDRPGSYFHSHGSGLGWGPGAALGVKLGRPDARVLNLVGDGSYLFGHPSASAWVGNAYDAPTLSIIYNNSGWNAVRRATLATHPSGSAASDGVPESKFDPTFDLSKPAEAVDTHTAVVSSPDELGATLTDAAAAVDAGTPSVVDVRIEPI